MNWGDRFCTEAATPSAKSAVFRSAVWAFASTSSAAETWAIIERRIVARIEGTDGGAEAATYGALRICRRSLDAEKTVIVVCIYRH